MSKLSAFFFNTSKRRTASTNRRAFVTFWRPFPLRNRVTTCRRVPKSSCAAITSAQECFEKAASAAALLADTAFAFHEDTISLQIDMVVVLAKIVVRDVLAGPSWPFFSQHCRIYTSRYDYLTRRRSRQQNLVVSFHWRRLRIGARH